MIAAIGEAIEKFIRWLATLGALCAFLIFTCMATDIVMREAFLMSTEYAIDLSELLMVPLVFFILPYVAQISANVRVDFLVERISIRKRRVVELMNHMLFLPFSILIGWSGWLAAHDAYRFGAITESGIPKWPVLATIPVGSALLVLQILILIGREWSRVLTRPTEENGE